MITVIDKSEILDATSQSQRILIIYYSWIVDFLFISMFITWILV